MQEELITLGILFFFALIGGILASRFKQPLIMGLLLVGAVIGPKALGIIHNESIMGTMIDFGSILILFVIGLEFDISKLTKIGLKAIFIAVLNSAILTFVGFCISLALGFSVYASLFMGVIMAFGSTVVIVKVLENKGYMDRQEVPLLIAILIIEDIIAVIIITFFSGIQNKATGLLGNIENIIIAMCALVIIYIAFTKFVKPLLEWIVRGNNSEEIITFMSLAMCAGFSFISSYLGLSPAVGAFLAGSIVASLPNAKEFQKSIEPYNLIISAFFFIAIGTMIDFNAIMQNIMIILILVLAVIIIKITAFSSIIYFFANMKGEKMFFSSIAMFSIGEFSLLVAKESVNFNIGIDLISISAAIIAISAVIMSIAIGYSDRIYEPTMDKLPWKMKKGMERMSNYIRSISDELDLESKHSRSLKKHVIHLVVSLVAILLALSGWKKLIGIVGTADSTLIYVVTGVIVSALLVYAFYNARNCMRILGEIFSNATGTRDAKHSRTMIIRAFLALGLMMGGILFPFVMFLFNMHASYIYISFIMIALSVWQLYKISKAANHDTHEQTFTSHHFDTTRHHNGWRM